MSIIPVKEESFKPFRLNKDKLHKFGIHRISVPEGTITKIQNEKKTSRLTALASWIDQYVTRNNLPNIPFIERIFTDNSWWVSFQNHGFHLKIFHSTSSKQTPFSRFFTTFGGDGDHTGKQNHYLYFFYRQLIQITNLGKSILTIPVSEVFVLTKGNAWQALKGRDCRFPISTFRRFASPKITQQNSRNFTGNSITRKESKTFLPSLTENLYQLTTYIYSVLKETAFMRSLPALRTQKGPTTAKIGIEMGMGFVKLGRQLTLPGYADLLNYLSEVYSGQKHPQLEDSGKKLSETDDEVDDLHFDFLDLIQRVNYDLTPQLENYRKDFLWDLFNNKKTPHLYFSHKFSKDLYSSPITPTFRGENLLSDPLYWDFPPTLPDVLNLLKSREEFQNLKDKKDFFNLINSVKISFFKGSRQISGSLLDFVNGEIKTKDHKTYFYIGGVWLEASAEYHVLLQREFNQLIKTHLAKPGDLEHLPNPWMCNIRWAAFTPDDIKKRLSDPTKASSFIDALKKASLCSSISKKKGHYLMDSQVDLSKMDYPKEDLKKLEDFLNERADFKVTHQYEGPYNEEYLYDKINDGKFFGPDRGWLPGDRIDHTARKIELFDVVRYTEDTVYLFHVKENFGGPTGIALNQLEYSAKQIQQVRQGNSSSNAIEEFWNEVMNSKKKGYRANLKKQLNHLGKENFTNIFRRPRIVFVYALIDGRDGEERLLENEQKLLEKIKFTAEEFNANKCLKFWNNPNTTPQEIYKLLETHQYLKNGHPTDKLLLCPEKRFFLDKKFGKTTQNPAIYKILKDKVKQSVSAYDSTGAKARLFSFKRELEKLGMTGAEFKICQIRRPKNARGFAGGSTSLVIDALETQTFSNLGAQLTLNREFTFEGVKYHRKTTEDDGSCALHALLGTEKNGLYIYPRGRHKGHQAKLDFINALSHTQNQAIFDLLRENLSSLFDESNKKDGYIYAKEIFDDPNVVRLNQKRILDKTRLENQLKDLATMEALIWEQLIESKEKIGKILLDALKKNQKVLDNKTDSKTLLSWINEDRNNFEKLLPKKAVQQIMDLVKQYRQIRKKIRINQNVRDQLKTNFLRHQEVWNSYMAVFLKLDYYLTSQEIKIAAHLFNKWVTELHYDKNKTVERSDQDFNPNPNLEHVTIFHEGRHFERCLPRNQSNTFISCSK